MIYRAALLAAICLVAAACASAPASQQESAVPPTYSQSVYRDAGVLNTPNNTGNPPQDLDPHTRHWRDVRPNY
jgi:hypothetical protein